MILRAGPTNNLLYYPRYYMRARLSGHPTNTSTIPPEK